MSIRKVVKIRNVGRFKDCVARGDVEFSRYTLVFAENGRGKTTLCAVLRSLQSGDVAYVVGRKTLGSDDAPEIQLLSDSGTHSFVNGTWNQTMSDLAIFDGTFVAENVYVGDVVDTEQRRNLYRFIIGEENVRLARRVDHLDGLIRQENTKLREKRAEVQQHIPDGLDFETFLSLNEDLDIDEKIPKKKDKLEAAKAGDAIVNTRSLSALTVPGIPVEFSEVLGKGFEEVAAEAEQIMLEHLTRHEMGTDGEIWLSEGLAYVRDDACPFCGRGLSGVQLIEAYRAYFSEAYESLRTEVAAVERDIRDLLGEASVAGIGATIVQNETLVQFWSQYCRLSPPESPDMTRVHRIFGALQRAMVDLLMQKMSALFSPATPSVGLREAQDDYEALRLELEEYNSLVATVNKIIEDRKGQAKTVDLAETRKELALLVAQKLRYSDVVKRLCEEHLQLVRNKDSLDAEKARARQELDDRTTQLMIEYQESINYFLDRFNAGFRLTGTQHTYRGGPPSSIYQILINDVPVELGNQNSPLDQPTFRNTLSAGDRSTLALAFFFARIKHEPKRADMTIILDDPFTSQDSFRRNQTVFQINKLGQECAQVVVLSHDMRFLHSLWERLQPDGRTALQLTRVGESNTTIQKWGIEQAVLGRHQQDLYVLQEFYAGEGDPRDVVQRIRPVLEAYCRETYPFWFTDTDMLGEIVRKIRGGDPSHPVFEIVDDLDELNEYTRRYHHGEDVGKAAEPIVDEELRGYTKRTLRIVGGAL